MRSIGNSSNSSRCRGSMTEIIFISVFAISNILMFRKGYKSGIKTEQQARFRRLNTLRKLINNRADL
jgi:hypothetical protein